MATIVGYGAESGGGKTTSLLSIHQGNGYLKPEQCFYFNCDKKDMPWDMGTVWGPHNYLETSDVQEIERMLKKISDGGKHFRAAFIDTANSIMVDREMMEAKKLNYDKWYDLAKDIWQLISNIRPLRKDLIVVIFFHIALYTDTDGREKKCIVTNGKKLEKIKLEAKFPVMLFGKSEADPTGKKPKYIIETFSNSSTGKSPIDMFSEEEMIIPNDISLVLQRVNEYYKLFADFNPDYGKDPPSRKSK